MERNLKEHSVKSFDEHFNKISNLILEMSNLTIESIELIEKTIKKGVNLAAEIKDHDKKINQHDHEIENEVVAFIALRQPTAYDLRFSISAIKVSANLERVGDYAKTVVKKLADVKISSAYTESLLKMTKLSKSMVKDATYCLLNNDLEKSKKVLNEDDKIDAIYQEIFTEFNSKKLSEASRELIHTIFIAKSIERLADHAVNIAEIVNYTVTGEIA